MWWTNFKDQLLRPFSFFGAYEAVGFLGSRLAPPSHFYTTFLVITAVGITFLAVYLLLTYTNRRAVAGGANAHSVDGPASAAATAPSLSVSTRGPLFPGLRRGAVAERSLYLVVREAPKDLEDIRHSLLRHAKLSEPFSLQTTAACEPWAKLWHIVRTSADKVTRTNFAEIIGPLEALPGRLALLRKAVEPNRLQRLMRSVFLGQIPFQPTLRGVVICVAADRLVGNAWKELADGVTVQLKTIGTIFRARTPVYLLITDAGAIPDFQPFAANLHAHERDQALGVTFSWNESNSADRDVTTRQLEKFFERLAAWRVILLSREAAPLKKPAIYEHPRQWLKMTPLIAAFIERAVGPLQHGNLGPVVRGLYVTGEAVGAKKPVPRDVTIVFPVIEANENLFLADLIKRVLFDDETRAYAPLTFASKKAWRLAFASVLLGAGLVLGFSFRSWWGNSDLLQNAREVTTLNSQPVSKLVSGRSAAMALTELENLDKLRKLVTDIEVGPYRSSFALRWGLYQGDRVLPSLRSAYFNRFRTLLLDPIREALTAQFMGLSAANPVLSYDSATDRLRLYLMIHGGDCSVDASFVQRKLSELWAERGITDPQGDTLAGVQFGFYAKELAKRDPYGLSPQPRVVGTAKAYLDSNRGPDQLYQALIQSANRQQSPASLSEALQNQLAQSKLMDGFKQVFSGPTEVEGAFSRNGSAAIKESLGRSNGGTGDSCGATPANISAGVQAQVGDKYLQAYQERWKKFLADIAVNRFNGPTDAASKLGIITQNQSPLLAIFALVSDNTGAAIPGQGAAGLYASLSASAKTFRPVYRVVPPGSKESWKTDSNSEYIEALRELERTMRDFADKPSDRYAGDAARRAADAADSAVNRIKDGFGNDTNGVDVEVERLLRRPILECRRILQPPDPSIGISQSLRAFCQDWATVQRKFPFNRQSMDDVSLADFVRIFQPQTGALWTLAKGVAGRSSGGQWAKSPEIGDVRLPNGFLDFLNRMSGVSDDFFQQPNGQPGMRFRVQITATPGVSASLQIGGESGSPFVWPGKNPSEGFLLRANGSPFLYPGLWGVYHMIENADERTPAANQVVLSKIRALGGVALPLEVGGQPAKVTLVLPDLPGGISGSHFSGLACPGQAPGRP